MDVRDLRRSAPKLSIDDVSFDNHPAFIQSRPSSPRVFIQSPPPPHHPPGVLYTFDLLLPLSRGVVAIGGMDVYGLA